MQSLIIGTPYLLQFNLIRDCIFNCEYCYLRNVKNKKISFNVFKKFLKKWEGYCNEYKISLNINLMGGDLWLHPEIFQILKYIHNLHYVTHIYLAVNNLWSKDARFCLRQVKDKIGGVQFNLDALEGRFDDLLFVQENKIPVGIKIVLTKQYNIKQRIKTAQRLNRLCPDLIIFIDRLCPQNLEEYKYALSLDELRETTSILGKTFRHFRSEDPLVKTLLLINKEKPMKLKKDEIRGCAIPNGGLAVYPDGKIKLCSRVSSFETGFNVRNFNLLDYISKFNYLGEKRVRCESCKFFPSCQGGCPATSFAKENRFSRDLHCLLQGSKINA